MAVNFDLLLDLAPRRDPREVPTTSPESVALSKALRKRGFGFVGPTMMHALMEATASSTPISSGVTGAASCELARRWLRVGWGQSRNASFKPASTSRAASGRAFGRSA